MDFALSSIALVPAWPLSARSRHSFASVKKNIPRVNRHLFLHVCIYNKNICQIWLAPMNIWTADEHHQLPSRQPSTFLKLCFDISSEWIFSYMPCDARDLCQNCHDFQKKSLFSVWFWLFSGIRQDRGQRGRIYGRWGSSISPVLSNKQFLHIYGIHVCILHIWQKCEFFNASGSLHQ